MKVVAILRLIELKECRENATGVILGQGVINRIWERVG